MKLGITLGLSRITLTQAGCKTTHQPSDDGLWACAITEISVRLPLSHALNGNLFRYHTSILKFNPLLSAALVPS